MNFLKKYLITFSLVLTTSPVSALAQENPEVSDFNFSMTVPEEVVAKVNELLEWAQQLKFSKTTPLHKDFFGSGNTGDVYINQIKRIEILHYTHSHDASTIAFIHPSLPRAVFLTNNYIASHRNRLNNLATLIHESRHMSKYNDKLQFHHAICPMKSLSGKQIRGHITGTLMTGFAACDDKLYGPYTTTVTMLYNISMFCTNCSIEERKQAGVIASRFLERIIDQRIYNKVLADWMMGYF